MNNRDPLDFVYPSNSFRVLDGACPRWREVDREARDHFLGERPVAAMVAITDGGKGGR